MQLSRNLFLSPDRNFRRKMQEVMLAIQIERRFTKPQIFTLYANQIYLGHGVYGFEAGANYYFGKKAKDLTLEEAAVLAGLPKAPNAYSPINNPERALHRRNLVINNMLEDGKITAEEAQRAKNSPIRLNVQGEPNSIAPYFVEEMRQYLEKKYGSEEVHEKGLRVYTSLNLEMQKAANLAVLDGLAAYEHRHGWKGSLLNVVANGESLPTYRHVDWDSDMTAGQLRPRAGDQRRSAVRDAEVWPLRRGAGPGRDQVDALHLAATVPDARRPGVREDRGAERHAEPGLAGAGVGRAGSAAGARQLHRRRQGHGRRPQLRAVEVQSRDPGAAPGGIVVQALHLHRRDRSGHDAGRHRARRAGQLSGRACRVRTRRTTTTASSRA